METRTRTIGNKTQRAVRRHSALDVQGLDSNMDYSFRRKETEESSGGTDGYGFTPVTMANSVGEDWAIPYKVEQKSKGKRQLVKDDVILCKRPKEAKEYFQAVDDEKYNAQVRLLRSGRKQGREKMRQAGGDLVDSSKGIDTPERDVQYPGYSEGDQFTEQPIRKGDDDNG